MFKLKGDRMAQALKTCFVISPIGAEGSEIRSDANDFLELLVEPALEKYGFNVTRADQISEPTAITTDIVRLVQESDLCLIDLTNTNPNVFYECGRRHETGKPFIQMIRRGHESSLPFDVAGIRTVTYDVSSTRAARESVLKLQEFIDSLVSAGFETTTSGDSLSSIAQGIERIERKINQLASSVPLESAGRARRDEEDDDVISLMMKTPREAFLVHLRKGRLDEAYATLDKLKRSIPGDEYMTALALVVSMGHARAFEKMDSELHELLEHPQQVKGRDEFLTTIAESVKKYFENIGEATQGIKYLITLYDMISGSSHFENEAKAFVANKVGMLAWNVDEYQLCIKYTRLALNLCPDDAAYNFNLALAYTEAKMETELHDTLKKLSRLPGLQPNHQAMLTKHGYEYAP